MFNFFLPRKTRQILSASELIYSSLQRNRLYAQDSLAPHDLEAVEALEQRYPPLLKAKDFNGLAALNKEVMKLGHRLFPPSPWDGWRENVEVFVVAAIMALAIRTFFLQPFKIPTGSMEPTLFGIEPVPVQTAPPNFLVQTWDFFIHGQTFSRVVTQQGGKIIGLTPGQMTIWFEYTDVHLATDAGGEEVKRIWIRESDVETKLGIYPYGSTDYSGKVHNEIYQPGDVLANYVTQTGDQVLVDKVTYNFRGPRRGEVIIFKTTGIDIPSEGAPEEEGSQDFIKRCIALAGDTVTVQPPQLFVDGHLAEGSPIFAKQFARSDGYPGYTVLKPEDSTGETAGQPVDPTGRLNPYDAGTKQTYYVQPNDYWAMGDNSPHSLDSRYWGGVPRQNLIGRGYFVFWPFTSRWGWIK